MFEVHRSESGQYVLLHRATGTVVVSDELTAGFETISERVRGAREDVAPVAETPVVSAPVKRGWQAASPWLLAIGLPFVWLLVLHVSLSRLASEMVVGMRAPAKGAQVASMKELDDLRIEVARVEARIAGGKAERRAPAAVEEPDEDEDEDEREKEREKGPTLPAPTSPATVPTSPPPAAAPLGAQPG